ncbi:MAG: hypothetical protein RDV41_15160 [Planctomycetota bacterium]|nr:hypothetical protein [Planctomycetota bacterium]
MNTAEETRETLSRENGVDFRAVVGLALLIGGCAMALWVFTNIYGIMKSPGDIGLLKQLSEATFELREVEMDGKKISFSQGFADVVRYALMELYLFVATILTTGVISAGAALVQPGVQRVAARLERKIEGVKGKMEELGKAIGEKVKGQQT